MKRLVLYFGLIILGCQQSLEKTPPTDVHGYVGITGNVIWGCERLIPFSLYDTNNIMIWREGSIFYSEFTSCLIIEKSKLNEDEIDCYFIVFDDQKPSNLSNWRHSSTYQLRLENIPFSGPFEQKTDFAQLDSLGLECNCEGIASNVYFIKEFYSDSVYPIHDRYNEKLKDNITHLFKQISKQEHIQTLALSMDSIDSRVIREILSSDSISYCIGADDEVRGHLRPWKNKY